MACAGPTRHTDHIEHPKPFILSAAYIFPARKYYAQTALRPGWEDQPGEFGSPIRGLADCRENFLSEIPLLHEAKLKLSRFGHLGRFPGRVPDDVDRDVRYAANTPRLSLHFCRQ